MTRIQICAVTVALSVAFGSPGSAGSMSSPASDQSASDTTAFSRRMADAKEWTTANLNVNATPSFCYDDAELNCRRYGRLYTWDAAPRACQALGDGWRLPTNEEWRQLGTRYGGLRLESADLGKAAFTALIAGGSSGFDAVLGGGRTEKIRGIPAARRPRVLLVGDGVGA